MTHSNTIESQCKSHFNDMTCVKEHSTVPCAIVRSSIVFTDKLPLNCHIIEMNEPIRER